MNSKFKSFFKWFIWIIILLLGIMFVYWFFDIKNNFNVFQINNGLAVHGDKLVPVKELTLAEYSPLSIFDLAIGIICLIYSVLYLVVEILSKFNIQLSINKKTNINNETIKDNDKN